MYSQNTPCLQQLQPVISEATSTKNPPPSHTKFAIVSSLKKMAPKSSASEIKQNPIQAALREKMAAQKTNDRTDPTPLMIPSQTVEPFQSSSSSSTIETTLKTQVPTLSQYAPKPHPTALINMTDPSNKPVSSPKKTPPEKQLSPMQTYEMSDREESDSDCESDEEDEQQRPKKSVSTNPIAIMFQCDIILTHFTTLCLFIFRFHCGHKRQTFIAHWNVSSPMVPIVSIPTKSLERF